MSTNPPSTPAEVIDLLGGSTAVSKVLGNNRSAVKNWRTDGIPAKFWPALARIAADKGVPGITVDFLEQMRANTAHARAA